MHKQKIPARTLKTATLLSGIGLHSGLHSTVRLKPAAAGEGIVFVRADLPGSPAAACSDVAHDAAPFRSVIKRGAAEIHTVEHLLSAFGGLGITDCTVEIDGFEVPGMDGSALDFANAIQNAGIVESGVTRACSIERTIELSDAQSKLIAEPASGGLHLTYFLDYPGHALAQGDYGLLLTPESFMREIAPARTFAIRKDAEKMRAAGLGKGANLQNTVIIDGDRALETKLRFPNEPVRHKILDLIGDLYLLGCPVLGRITARCTGHRQNRELVQKLAP